jgi:hypothetical protein
LKLNKGILKPAESFPEISEFKAITGIILGLAFAVSLYLLLYLTRDIFRVLSIISAQNDVASIWILSDAETRFYNFFYASIALIIGQSVCLTYWFDLPRKYFSRRNLPRHLVVPDQKGLNYFFLSWFSQLAVLFGVFFCVAIPAGFRFINLHQDYKEIFFLIPIVLYLNTWTSIRRRYKKQSFKWMIITLITLSLLSYGLSRINPVDYRSINQILMNSDTKEST